MSHYRGPDITHDFGAPGQPVELHRGETELVGVGKGRGTVSVALDGKLSINWAIDLDDSAELGEGLLRVLRPGLGSVDVQVRITHSDGRGNIPEADLGGGVPLQRVLIYWANIPAIYCVTRPRDEHPHQRGHWECQAAGWRLTLDERDDLNSVVKDLKGSQHLALTHAGELSRADGSEFSANDAADALFAFHLGLSFALGRWVAPALPIGFDKQGNRVWERWAPWRCDIYSGFLHWWDTHTGDALAEFLQLFMTAWGDRNEHDIVWHVAYHIISANHGGTTVEGRIMLAQAALEYLAWTTFVLSGQVTRKQYKDIASAEHLRQMLTAAAIPTGVPVELEGLQQLATQKGFDGAQSITWVRNRLVHPKDPGEPYRIKNVVWQAWLLAMHYAELLLLHRLEYQGPYLPRIPPDRFEHDRVNVPWA